MGFSDPETAKKLESVLKEGGNAQAEVFIYDGVGHAFMNSDPVRCEPHPLLVSLSLSLLITGAIQELRGAKGEAGIPSIRCRTIRARMGTTGDLLQEQFNG